MGAAVTRLFGLGAAVPFLAGGFFLSHSPVGLAVHAGDAQLRITWDRHAGREQNLEILDGAARATLSVPPALSSVTYQVRGPDVQVRLSNGETDVEIARCIGREPPSVAVVRREMQKTKADAENLRASVRKGTREIERMQQIADQMLARVPQTRPQTVLMWR